MSSGGHQNKLKQEELYMIELFVLSNNFADRLNEQISVWVHALPLEGNQLWDERQRRFVVKREMVVKTKNWFVIILKL